MGPFKMLRGRARAIKLTQASTLLLAGCVFALAAASSSNSEHDNFFDFMRPRVGYFSNYSPSGAYSKIYEEYFAHVIRMNDQAMESLPADDWRKVRPTGELCFDFLIGLRVKSYVMSKPFELIILDACLDWLFNESDPLKVEERATDQGRLDSARKLGLKTLTSDAKLRQIYRETRMKDEKALSAELLQKIYDYLVRLLNVYSSNPRNGCHSLWLEAYNDFVDDVYVQGCEDEANCRFFGLDDSQQDSYLSMLVESTKQAAKSCYNVMQKQIHGLVEAEFERSNTGTTSIKKRFMRQTNRVVRQSESEKWAREMISILQLASGLSQDSPINLGDVATDLYKIKNDDEALKSRFTQALSDYASNNVDLKESKNDGLGRARYGRAMMKLCRPYTDKKMFLSLTGGVNMDEEEEGKKPFEFYGLIYSLVRLTNHEQLFDITKDAFEDQVIANRWEALYLATFACQIISTTWGELTYDSNSGAFDVRLRPEWNMMVLDWPIEVLHEKLPILYAKNGNSKAAARAAESSGQPAFSFGKKFKSVLKMSKKNDEDEDEPVAKLAELADSPPAAPLPAPEPAAPPAPPAAAPKPAAEAPVQHLAPAAGSVNSYLPARHEPKIMSWETIQMYKDLHGKYPQLPDFYKKIYPQLPDDLTGVYPKKLPMAKPSAAPASTNNAFGSYGAAFGAFGGSSASGSSFGGASNYASNGGFGGNSAFGGNSGFGVASGGSFGGQAGFNGNSGFGASSGFGGSSGGSSAFGSGSFGGGFRQNAQQAAKKSGNTLSALTF